VSEIREVGVVSTAPRLEGELEPSRSIDFVPAGADRSKGTGR
jgi:hypothetical protein